MHEDVLDFADPVDRVSWCLSAAAVNRVTSITPVYFGAIAGPPNTDLFDIKQGVEMIWRDLRSRRPSVELRAAVLQQLPMSRQAAITSGLPGTVPVLRAIDAIGTLLDGRLERAQRASASFEASMGVALAFDALGEAPPDAHPTWLDYELAGQASLIHALPAEAADVTDDQVYDLRTESGAASMAYRRAILTLLRR